MGDRSKGLYPEGKFVVLRKDGTDAPGKKHYGCQYFVLDITHDQHAIPALRAYGDSARNNGYELLAADLDKIHAGAQITRRVCRWSWTSEEGNTGFWEAQCKKDEDWPIGLLHEDAKFCSFCGGELIVEGQRNA